MAPAEAGTRHSSISAAEIWTYAASPHIIPFDVNIAAAVTMVTGGGAPQAIPVAYWGALRMQPPDSTGTLHLDDVEIAGSMSQGVYVPGSVGFDATSQNFRVHGSVGYPVHVYARVVGSVPSGNYIGNSHDAIAIAGSGGPVVDAQTMHDRGVPYYVGSGADSGRMDVAAPVGSVAARATGSASSSAASSTRAT